MMKLQTMMCVRTTPVKTMLLTCLLCLVAVSISGCSTLASLGLPFGSTSNQILRSAKGISDQHQQSLQLPGELTKAPLSEYIVEVGDTIFVEATKFDATIRLPGDQVVKPDGMVSLGEFGRVGVMGKSLHQIEVEVQALLESTIGNRLRREFEENELRIRQASDLALGGERPDIDDDKEDAAADELERAEEEATLLKQRRLALERRIDESVSNNRISVRLVNWDSKKIYVLGEVNSPGSFPYSGNQTVLDAIIEAGGVSSRSNHHDIIVSRPTECGGCRIVAQICYDHIVQLGDTSTNYQLMPGDRVFVPSLTFLDDVKQSLSFGKEQPCPRCAQATQGCTIAEGCGNESGCESCESCSEFVESGGLAVGQLPFEH